MTVETLIRPDSMRSSIVSESMACATHDPELWFADHPAAVATAQAVCGTCPLRIECLAGALEREEPWGIWGGEVFEGGQIVARRRRPGRPTRDDASHALAASHALSTRLAEYGRTEQLGRSDLGADQSTRLAEYGETSESAA